MRRGGEGLGGKDHAELRKKKLRGDTRMDKSHSRGKMSEEGGERYLREGRLRGSGAL